MDHGHGEIRTNIEVDKLSNLPDDLIHKILAFISIKHAIRTSVLSSRWKYIWTSLPCLNFSTDDFYSLHELLEFLSTELLHLENVDICIYRIFEDEVAYTRKIVDVLQQLHSVKFLTLNLELVKLLSFSVEVISCQPSPFVNLKGLKIYPVDVTPEEHTQTKVTMSTEVKNYLLDGSRGATFTMVSHEEIRAVKNDASARNLMRELQVLVDEWKGNNEANTQMNREDLEVENGYRNTRCMILMLRKIEGVLAKLPALQRAKLQEKFSALCKPVPSSN
ncbi:hypothetical protein L1987_72243 [Smallanthus sonchifolius]|uniref:Uncharacterized protein n=1 Tax=Smallanthus sonchifolius TaxID=185202 RepID=A0ACB9AUP7_9ASTR|nr:hypothetical protein L1987_72243 [Smallanthus sonchifolius]